MAEHLKAFELNKKPLYSIVQFGETKELHIFLSRRKPISKECVAAADASLCQGMSLSDAGGAVETCMNEDQTRYKAAEIGRAVCGNCIRRLYATYRRD